MNTNGTAAATTIHTPGVPSIAAPHFPGPHAVKPVIVGCVPPSVGELKSGMESVGTEKVGVVIVGMENVGVVVEGWASEGTVTGGNVADGGGALTTDVAVVVIVP